MRLKQIKGAEAAQDHTLDEIKNCICREETLEAVVSQTQADADREEENRLKEVRTCENIPAKPGWILESLDQSILDGDRTFWEGQLQKSAGRG